MKESQFNYKMPQTLNPYRVAISLIIKRLKWDLKLYSWDSRSKLKKMKDAHKGKKAIIICNGPSLKGIDFDSFRDKDVYFFGLNKINLMFDETDFRPDFIVASNYFVIEQNQEFFNQTNIPLFINSDKYFLVKNRKNVAFLNYSSIPRRFSLDCSISMFQGFTVTYSAMQLAFHMGFEKVALIGCDHNFKTKGVSNKTVIAEEEDPNHFHPKYFADGVKWDLPDLIGSEHHYELAKQVFEENNRKLYNCTEGGKLEIFERMSLNDFLEI
jgi:hypothetical protein